MSDANLTWGSDLTIGPTGDLGLVSNTPLNQQRILRRLLTNLNDYVWHADYGAGLGQLVGAPADEDNIAAVILHQLQLESSIAAAPPPVIFVANGPSNVVSADIKYIESTTGSAQILSFSLSI